MGKEVNRDWQAVNSKYVDKILSSSNFIHRDKCGCGLPIFTFRIPGESVEGRLRPCGTWDRADRAKTAEIWFYNQTGKEIGFAIRLSKMLWDTINNKDDHLWGKWIRITYKGSERTQFGHAKKIYLVEIDKGTLREHFEGVEIYGTGKQSKPRKRKPISRPNNRNVQKTHTAAGAKS